MWPPTPPAPSSDVGSGPEGVAVTPDEASPPAPVCPAAAQASLGAGSLAGAEGVVAVAPLGLQALFRHRRRVRRAGCPEPAGSRRRERVRVVLTGLMVAGVRIAVLAVCQPVKKTPPVC